MASLGLQGMWGLEQLDRTGIATWKLGLLLIGSSTVLAFLARPILSDVNTESIVFESLPTDLYLGTGFFLISFLGIILFLTVALGRSTEDDLRALTPLDDSVTANLEGLRPQGSVLLAVAGLFVILVPALSFSSGMWAMDMSMSEFAGAINSAGRAATLVWYVIMPIVGIALAPLTITVVIQPMILYRVVTQLDIDLLQMAQYQVVANPLVRFVIAMLLVISSLPLLSFWLDSPSLTAQLLLLGSGYVVLLGLIACFFFYPVLVLKNRVRKKKEDELKAVYKSLGNDSSNFRSPEKSATPQRQTDLLTQLMFLESRWEWPIASHVTKLVLWGLLVPFTWVLSATIENVLY